MLLFSMERRPHYALDTVKALATDPARVKFTRVALDGAADLGFDSNVIRCVVAGLRREDFFKSMTTILNPAIWQDVYRPTVAGVQLYIKVTVFAVENLLVVSFKRK